MLVESLSPIHSVKKVRNSLKHLIFDVFLLFGDDVG